VKRPDSLPILWVLTLVGGSRTTYASCGRNVTGLCHDIHRQHHNGDANVTTSLEKPEVEGDDHLGRNTTSDQVGRFGSRTGCENGQGDEIDHLGELISSLLHVRLHDLQHDDLTFRSGPRTTTTRSIGAQHAPGRVRGWLGHTCLPLTGDA
jgi:hypothetical protein